MRVGHRRRRLRSPARDTPGAGRRAVRGRSRHVGRVLRAVAGRGVRRRRAREPARAPGPADAWATSPRSPPTRCWRASASTAGASTISPAGSMPARRCSSPRRPISWSRWSSTRPSQRVDAVAFAAKGLADRLLRPARRSRARMHTRGDRSRDRARRTALRGAGATTVRSRRPRSPNACAGSSTAGWSAERDDRADDATMNTTTGGLTLAATGSRRGRARRRPPARFLGRRPSRARPRRSRARARAGHARVRGGRDRGRPGRPHAGRAGAVGAVGRAARTAAAVGGRLAPHRVAGCVAGAVPRARARSARTRAAE